MHSAKGVNSESDVPEIVSISCSTCGTSHDSPTLTGNHSYVTVVIQTHPYKTK